MFTPPSYAHFLDIFFSAEVAQTLERGGGRVKEEELIEPRCVIFFERGTSAAFLYGSSQSTVVWWEEGRREHNKPVQVLLPPTLPFVVPIDDGG